MAENSKIEWTTNTFNPWWGCTHVHEGCRHCYAETWANRFGVKWGPSGVRRLSSESVWKQPLKWNRAAEKAGVRAKVFCSSMADVFEDWQGPIVDGHGDEVTVCHGCGAMKSNFDCGGGLAGCDRVPRRATMDDVRARLFTLIDSTPWLDWQLLTKRPENIPRMWPTFQYDRSRPSTDFAAHDNGHRRNVWLGTSISDQTSAETQVPELLKCRDLSPVLFLSCEPLLGPIQLKAEVHHRHPSGDCLRDWHTYQYWLTGEETHMQGAHQSGRNLDWVIAGGESGNGARPMHPDWARSLRDQCAGADVAFFFKQWGEWLPWDDASLADRGCMQVVEITGPNRMVRVGKEAAGRMLDGREWSEFPIVETAVSA